MESRRGNFLLKQKKKAFWRVFSVGVGLPFTLEVGRDCYLVWDLRVASSIAFLSYLLIVYMPLPRFQQFCTHEELGLAVL